MLAIDLLARKVQSDHSLMPCQCWHGLQHKRCVTLLCTSNKLSVAIHSCTLCRLMWGRSWHTSILFGLGTCASHVCLASRCFGVVFFGYTSLWRFGLNVPGLLAKKFPTIPPKFSSGLRFLYCLGYWWYEWLAVLVTIVASVPTASVAWQYCLHI